MDSKPTAQLRLPYGGSDCTTLAHRSEHPVGAGLLESILEAENLRRALRQVEGNGGSAGVDGMSVKKLRSYLKEYWPDIRSAILSGRYSPNPVRRVEIPKPGGGVRKLGVPTVGGSIPSTRDSSGTATTLGATIFAPQLRFPSPPKCTSSCVPSAALYTSRLQLGSGY